MKTQIPKQFSKWYSQKVKIARGMDRSVHIYQLGFYVQLASKTAANMRRYGTVESPKHILNNFFEASAFTLGITRTGVLDLPDVLINHLGHRDNFQFKEDTNCLTIA